MPTATANMKMLSISIPRASKTADDVSWSSTSPSESPLSTSGAVSSSAVSAPASCPPRDPWAFTSHAPGAGSRSAPAGGLPPPAAPAAPTSPVAPLRQLSHRSSWRSRRRKSASAAEVPVPRQDSVLRRRTTTATVAPSVSTPTLVPLPTPSKARHKKFHRHFDSIAPDERVLNYYSCALVSDILLQGQLYITSNYFAFYSNVFGYVTKLLIPTSSVIKVTKEKTARIIPNAIGVATVDEKHVFGSLLSRDNTYKLMVQVWKTALGPPAPQPLARSLPLPKDFKDEVDSASASGDILQEDDDSSLSGDAGLPAVPLDKIPIVTATSAAARGVASSVAASSSSILAVPALGAVAGQVMLSGAVQAVPGAGAGHSAVSGAMLERTTRQTVLLAISTALVAFLLLSTAFLFHRISRIQDQFRIQSGDNLYQDLARWQTHLHARSTSQVEEFLNTHLDQLAKVRKSLEALTMLIVSSDDDRMQEANMIHQSPYQDQNKQQTRPPSPEETKNS